MLSFVCEAAANLRGAAEFASMLSTAAARLLHMQNMHSLSTKTCD
jgi:hypothetical protein